MGTPLQSLKHLVIRTSAVKIEGMMPKGPKGQNRPSDTIANAVKVTDKLMSMDDLCVMMDAVAPKTGRPKGSKTKPKLAA